MKGDMGTAHGQDGPFDLEQEAQQRARRHEIEENRRASVPVVTELNAAGYPVTTVGQLYNYRLNYREAIPILLRWLPRVENRAVKEEIVRALSVKWAKPWAARPLIHEFRRAEDPTGMGLRWAIGNALSVVADDSVFDEMAQLVTDRSYGMTRDMAVVALANMRNPRAVDVLIDLLDDDEVAAYAVRALRKLRAPKARPYLERLLTHPEARIRDEARRALVGIDKHVARQP